MNFSCSKLISLSVAVPSTCLVWMNCTSVLYSTWFLAFLSDICTNQSKEFKGIKLIEDSYTLRLFQGKFGYMQGLGCRMFYVCLRSHCLKEVVIPLHHEYIMPTHAVLLCHACDTCLPQEISTFNLIASLYASSGHFPGFENSISISLRWTIIIT